MEISDKTCHHCLKKFSGNSQLYRHLREVHQDYEIIKRFYEKDHCIFKCLEGCNVSFRYNRDLRIHLNNCHGFNIIEKTKQFDNLQGFQKFRQELQENGSQYIKHQRAVTNKVKGTKVTYYACNRTGKYREKINDRKRQLKKNGSRKINAGCTSYLKLEENVDDGNIVKVYYCLHHYGHKLELEHLPLTHETRASIVDKLLKGATLVKVDLNEGGIEFDGIQRSDLLTKSDIKSLAYFSKSTGKKLEPSVLKMKSNEGYSHENYERNVVNVDTDSVNDDECMESKIVIGEEHLFYNDNENIEMHDVEEEQGPSESKHHVEEEQGSCDSREDEFGCYVAEMLKNIDPTDRDTAREAIDLVLKCYLPS